MPAGAREECNELVWARRSTHRAAGVHRGAPIMNTTLLSPPTGILARGRHAPSLGCIAIQAACAMVALSLRRSRCLLRCCSAVRGPPRPRKLVALLARARGHMRAHCIVHKEKSPCWPGN